MNRRGIALIAVLWVVALVGGAAATGLVMARDAITASRYRMAQRRARWEAEGCLAEARRMAERALRDERHDPIAFGLAAGACRMHAEPFSADTADARVRVRVTSAGTDVVQEVWLPVGRRVAVVARELP